MTASLVFHDFPSAVRLDEGSGAVKRLVMSDPAEIARSALGAIHGRISTGMRSWTSAQTSSTSSFDNAMQPLVQSWVR